MNISERIAYVEGILQKAAEIEKRIPDKQRAMLEVRSNWPEYHYDNEDKRHWFYEENRDVRFPITAKDIDLWKMVKFDWINRLGMETTARRILGKKIVWARSYVTRLGKPTSYAAIGRFMGLNPRTVENYYKNDIDLIARKVEL